MLDSIPDSAGARCALPATVIVTVAVAVPPCASVARYVKESVVDWPFESAVSAADTVGSYVNEPSAFIVIAAPLALVVCSGGVPPEPFT